MKQLAWDWRVFGGKDTKHDSTQLVPGENGFARALDYKGYLQGSGSLDGKDVGVGLNYIGVSSGDGFGLCQYTWDAPDGNQYVIKYTSDGGGIDAKLIYWLNPTLTNASTALTAWTGTNLAAGTAIMTNFVPSFADIGSGSLLVALGPYGIYRLTPTASTLAAVAVTSLPASSQIAVANNRLWIVPCDESVLRWSPKGDYTRLLPKLAEIEADTYGIDYRYTLQSQGCDGNVVGLFACDAYKAVWTQKDLFIVVGNGDSNKTAPARGGKGFGLGGFKGFTYKDGILYWYSKYNGGRILGGVTGEIPGDRNQIHAVTAGNFALRIFDATDMVPDELKNCPTMDCDVESFVCDSRSDFEDTTYKIYSKTNLSTTEEPGYVKIADNSNAIAYTAVFDPIISDLAVNGSFPLTNLNDGAPLYDSVDTPTPTSCKISGTNWNISIPYTDVYLDNTLQSTKLDGINSDNTWQRIILPTPTLASTVTLKTRVLRTGFAGVWVKLVLSFPTTFVSRILVFNHQLTIGTPGEWIIGEIRIEGSTTSVAYLTSKVVKLTGLTSANNAIGASSRACGRFLLSYIGTGSDGTGGLTGSTFTAPQIRGDDASFADDAADSGANSWYSLTATDLTQGVDLTAATAGTGAMTFAPDANGNLWVQFRVPFTVTAGISPKLDSAGFYFWRGNNLKSISPMGYKNDQLFACVRTTSDSSQPDKEVCVNTKTGEISIIDGKQVYSYLNYNDTCYADEYYIHEQYAGVYNYQSSSHTATTLPRVWESGEIAIPGHSIYPRDINVAVKKYDPSTSVLSNSVTIASTTTDCVQDLYDKVASVYGYDGNIYAVLTNDTNNVDINLYRVNPNSGAVATTAITGAAPASVGDKWGVACNAAKTMLYVVYLEYAGSSNRYLYYRAFNIETQTLSDAQTIHDTTTNSLRSCGITCVGDEVHICAWDDHGATEYLHHYYSDNPNDTTPTWTSGTDITTTAAVGSQKVRLYKTYDNRVGCHYFDGTNNKWTVWDGSAWATAITTRAKSGTGNDYVSYISYGGYDYFLLGNTVDSAVYIYTYNPGSNTWDLRKTLSSVTLARNLCVAPINANELVLVTNTPLDYSIGQTDTWDAIADYTNATISADSVWFLNKDDRNHVYAIGNPSNTFALTPIVEEITGLPISCDIITNNGVYNAFTRYDSISSTTHLPASGRCFAPGKSDWCRLRITSYGATEIGGVGLTVDVSN